jgi:hypothetical protein
MEKNSEWRLFAASIAVDAFLEAWYGFKNPFVHLLLLGSATWLSVCALLTHAIAWGPIVLREWGNLLRYFCAISGAQRRALEELTCDFLRFLYLPYEVFVALRDFKNLPGHPCFCGSLRADGTRATLGECCWKRGPAKPTAVEVPPDCKVDAQSRADDVSPSELPSAKPIPVHKTVENGSILVRNRKKRAGNHR